MSAKSQNSLRQNMLASFGDIELILVTISDFSPRYFRAQKIEQKDFAFFFGEKISILLGIQKISRGASLVPQW